MKEKPLVRSQAATRDLQNAARHYRSTATVERAQKFVGALEEAYLHISRMPRSGSPRYSHLLDVTDLRSWPVSGFPYLVLYVEREHSIDIYRVLHTARDIPASFSDITED